MRVCLDARKLWDSGIGTYIRGLLDGFSQIAEKIEWDFIVKPDDASSSALKAELKECYASRAPNYSISELFSSSRIANRTSSQLYHAPHYVIPFAVELPLVVTVHDLIHLKFPRYFPEYKRAYARWMLNRVCKSARTILTVSERTREDLIEVLGFHPDIIHVCYVGVNRRYFEPVSEEQMRLFRQEYGLPADYLLYVGNLKAHKNVSGLIEAWAGLADSIRPALVIVGAKKDHYPFLMRQVHDLGREKEVFFTGSLPDEVMVSLYRCAKGYVQPSWYEGFGSPPLEAMASGIPVAVSNRGSLPEIAADGALIFDPGQHKEMKESIEKLLTDEQLRNDLLKKGLARAVTFSWEKTAKQTLEVYKIALEAQ